MSCTPSITCDRAGCTMAVAANGYDCGPEGWLRLSPGSVSEPTKDFCSAECLAQWAARQVNKSLVTWNISAAVPYGDGGHWYGMEAQTTKGTPVKSGLDFTKPFGCWPENARRPDVGALNGRQG